ncbi:MAG: hypothetical protein LBU44_04320 [Mediterranea sp.]|jgi:hypothetical protein|nr:hypothetical protein [Mediterranea sp.]
MAFVENFFASSAMQTGWGLEANGQTGNGRWRVSFVSVKRSRVKDRSGKPGVERNEVQRSEDLQRMAWAAGNAQII